MTTAQLWAAALTGTLLTTLLAGVKFAFDAVTGRRVRRVSDGKAELELAEMVKRVAADEVATLTVRLERTEGRAEKAHVEIVSLRHKVSELEEGRTADQAEIATNVTEIAGLQRRVMGVIDDRDELVRYITVLQVWIASGARPPAPDVPAHLADVLPAWIPVDGAEPPVRARPEGID